MKINRRATLTVKTTRRTVTIVEGGVQQTPGCPGCGSPMKSTRGAALMLGIETRDLFRLVEIGSILFVETADRETFVCPECATQPESRTADD